MRDQLKEDTFDENENYHNEDFLCPICNYPLVYEQNLPVCYNCGWYEGIYEGYYDL